MGGEEEEGFRVLRCGASAPPPPPEPRPKLLEENNQKLKLTAKNYERTEGDKADG